MNIRWLRHWAIKPTIGVWASQNLGMPPQQAAINQWCQDHSVTDRWTGSSVCHTQHDMISLVIQDEQFVSIQTLDSVLRKNAKQALRFLHLSVNKFLLYSETDSDQHKDIDDLDLRLIRHWCDVVGVEPIYTAYCSDDTGNLGNWVYPITNVIWKVNDQT